MTLKGYEWLRAQLETSEGRAKVEKTRKLESIAKGMGVSVAQLSIAWCLKNPFVSTVILGASKRSQLDENLKAQAVIPQLNADLLNQIHKVVGS